MRVRGDSGACKKRGATGDFADLGGGSETMAMGKQKQAPIDGKNGLSRR
ncbi:hypothetical protein [Sporotomaculum syntrophicum]|nr:hypothetical protein [Sporotomaculum syntrophicum]